MKRQDHERVGAGSDRPAGSDVAVAGIHLLRARAKKRDLFRMRGDDTPHALDAPSERCAVADVVVARKDSDRRLRVAAREL